MTLNYVGNRQFRNRLAEFGYTENEEDTALDILAILENDFGYDVKAGVQGWAAIRVDDRDEFNEVMKDYKEAKKMLRSLT